MKRLASFGTKLRLGKFLTILLVGLVLVISTACSSGSPQGANPGNPSVQAGGMNNPHKAGGDSYVNNKLSTDSKSNSKEDEAQSSRADLSLNFNSLIAAVGSDSASKLLYPGGENPTTTTKSIPSEGREKAMLKQANRTSKEPQPTLVQRDPDANLLEKVGDEFRDASAFLKTKADEAGARPEAQANPAK